MGKVGKYIYGITTFKGVAAGLACDSLNGAYLIPYQDISAVVSDSEVVDYTRMVKDALAKSLVEHQKVIERIMAQGYTIIPMRIGTFATDEVDVNNILKKGYGLIKEIIQKVNNKIEIDVVVTWNDFFSVIKEIGEEKEIKEFKEKLLSIPKGIIVDDQIKAGAMAKDCLDRKRERCSRRIQNYLRNYCEDVKTHELMDDKMVVNSAFLMNISAQKEFEKKIEELNDEFEEKMNFRCIGPLPPYSFYTLEIKKLQFQDIDWAKKKMGLNNATNKDEIEGAYHRAAFSSHPDRNPNTPGIEKEFNETNRAYKILIDYCQAYEQTSQEELFFTEEEFKKNAILVKLKL